MQNSHNGSTTPNNWSFSFDLADTKAIGEGTRKNAPEGYYQAIIVETSHNPERQSIEFVVEIIDGDFKGCRCEKGIKLPSAAKNQFVWKSLFQSLGYPDHLINQKGFAPNPSEWVNQPVFIYWRNGNKETQTYRELLFMAQKVWEYKKQKHEATVAQPSSSVAAPAVSTRPSTPSAPVSQTIPQAQSPKSGFSGMNTASLLNSLNR